MIQVYTQLAQGQQWLQQYQEQKPIIACILGFTATGLIPGISAAGATPEDRKYTAIADAEFLVNGVTPHPQYPLPPLKAGASPVLISRAVIEAFDLPVYVFNAGLPQPPSVPTIDLGGVSANCLTSGNALPLHIVKHLFEQGLKWGEKLASQINREYLIISECVVGGTTTALSILTGLGIPAVGKVNSSHPSCNHDQKWAVVQAGLKKWEEREGRQEDKETVSESSIQPPDLSGEKDKFSSFQSSGFIRGVNPKSRSLPIPEVSSGIQRPKIPNPQSHDPFKLVAAIGDPMQIAAAGMAIAASRRCGVLLAGGTQMLAVYALARALTTHCQEVALQLDSGQAELSSLTWQPQRVVVGTTRWVVEDSTGDTIGLAQAINDVPLLATQLNLSQSRYPQLRAYEQGYVKEGVGAGGCAIAAHLYQGWNTVQLLQAIESLVERSCQE